MIETTLIRNADFVVAWDSAAKQHCYLRNTDLVFRGNEFTFVGKSYDGDTDHVIDGGGHMVMPGFINIHTHPFSEPGNRGLTEDLGSPQFGQSTLYEYLCIFSLDNEAAVAAMRVAFSEMLKSGVTTVVDMSIMRDAWADQVAETGIRGVLCPMVRSGAWLTRDGRSIEYRWDEETGERDLELSLAFIDQVSEHPSGRLDGMVGPAQIDTCTPALLQASHEAARARGIPLQVHAAQSLEEFREMTRRYGLTPVEFMDSVGILGPDTILGHGIFLNDHPWLHWPQGDDFGLLSRSGAAVAHCPANFTRRGIALNHLRRYVEAGIPVGLGTDTYPHNMIDEMKLACVAARLTSGDYTAGLTKHAFTAATVGGAKAIQREDLGRIAPGAKADFSLVDLSHAYLQPLRDPLRSLVFSANDRAVRDVYVDGTRVVKDGEVLNIDIEKAVAELRAGQQRMIASVSEADWAGREIDELAPRTFAVRESLG